ncbi:MAG: Gfo/Idh/MocA family protein [Promethearchaeota archaeon]
MKKGRKNKKRKPITGVIMGAGGRGREAYGRYAEKHPDRLNIIAVAEPNEWKRKHFQKLHNIPDKMAFSTWEDLLDQGKIADVAFVTMGDHLHYEPAMKALDLGYDILLEKPIAPTLEQCQNLEKKAIETGRIVQVGHVLRFSGFWKKVKEIIDSGKIGRVIHYEHSENVSYWHFGHSFVRGFYKNKETSNPLILSKSCHDLDLMTWYLGKPISVQSTGDLTFYRLENAPKDAPERCTDGCPHANECPWYAPRLYIENEDLIRIGTEVDNFFVRNATKFVLNHRGFIKKLSKIIPPLKQLTEWRNFPVSAITTDFSEEGKLKALKEGQFGLCIFKCGNDVVDHQVSTFEFADGVTGTLIVHGLSEHEGRELRIFGTKGTLRGYFRAYGEKLILTDFRYRKPEIVYKSKLNVESGHGGSDFALMDAFTSVLLGEKSIEEAGLTTISSAMESHYMGFAAEDARITGKKLNIDEYRLQKDSNL